MDVSDSFNPHPKSDVLMPLCSFHPRLCYQQLFQVTSECYLWIQRVFQWWMWPTSVHCNAVTGSVMDTFSVTWSGPAPASTAWMWIYSEGPALLAHLLPHTPQAHNPSEPVPIAPTGSNAVSRVSEESYFNDSCVRVKRLKAWSQYITDPR